MYTIIRVFLGDLNQCIEGSNIIEGLEGSAAFELKKLAAQERNERNSKRQSDKMKRGVHNFQVYARKMLEAWCIEVHVGDDVLSIYQSIYQSKLMERGEHNFQEHARMMLEELGVKVPEGGNVQSIYQSIPMKENRHNFQVYARKMLEEWGVEVHEGGNVQIIYQRELAMRDQHNFQVHAKKTLEEWGVEVHKGGNVQSIYQRKLAMREQHNFQVHAKKMLEEMGVEVPEGGNVQSIYNKKLADAGKMNLQDNKAIVAANRKRVKDKYDVGENNFQNLKQESIDTKNLKQRLTQLNNALVTWDKNFKKFEEFGTRMPTYSECRWLSKQREASRGIECKVEFEHEHGNGSTEWKDRFAKLVAELHRKSETF